MASGARKTATASATVSPEEETARPAAPGTYSETSASGPPIDATAAPTKSDRGNPGCRAGEALTPASAATVAGVPDQFRVTPTDRCCGGDTSRERAAGLVAADLVHRSSSRAVSGLG